MTAKEKLTEETEKIASFIGNNDMLLSSFKTLSHVDRIIERFIALGYSHGVLSTVLSNKTISYSAWFQRAGEPYEQISVSKGCKSSLDANYKLILEFIDYYESRPKELN